MSSFSGGTSWQEKKVITFVKGWGRGGGTAIYKGITTVKYAFLKDKSRIHN